MYVMDINRLATRLLGPPEIIGKDARSVLRWRIVGNNAIKLYLDHRTGESSTISADDYPGRFLSIGLQTSSPTGSRSACAALNQESWTVLLGRS
jgi:hypothetical protein